MQTTEDKVDSSKALDASLVDTESSGTTLKRSKIQAAEFRDMINMLDDADIRPIYDEEPMTEDAWDDQNAEQCHDTCPLLITLTDNKPVNLNFSTQSLDMKIFVSKKLSYAQWKPTGKIFKTVGLRWVPTGKIFTSSTTKVDTHIAVGFLVFPGRDGVGLYPQSMFSKCGCAESISAHESIMGCQTHDLSAFLDNCLEVNHWQSRVPGAAVTLTRVYRNNRRTAAPDCKAVIRVSETVLHRSQFVEERRPELFERLIPSRIVTSIPEFRDTLIQHIESVKKSIDERAQHKREYDSWVNERQMQTTEEKVDTSKALDASLVDIESSGTESKEQDTSSRSGNDAHADDADIRPIYDEEPMAEVQTTAKINVFATGQQHTEQPEFNNEGEVDQNAKQCHDTCPLPAKLTDNQTTKLSNQSLESENIYVIETINIELEHKVAKLLKENETLKRHYKELFDSIKTTRAKTIEHTTSLIAKNDEFKAQLQEKGFAIAALKNELRKLTGNSVNTKFAKSSILGKPVLQPHRNQSVVRQPTAFKSERPRISKPRFASQVDVNNDLSKPVTTHYLPKERESAVAKPHHMIAPGSSRYSSNDMVHNHYLEEAKKKTQESSRNSRPSVMPSAKSQSTVNGSKPKPRINNQKSRNWPASKSSCVTTKTVPIAEHSRNSRNFSDSKHFVCSTCQKCVFNANHDSCVTKFLNEVNSRAKVPSNKTTNKNKPVEQTSFAKKPERQIPKGHRFSIKKTFVVHEKTMTPRSCLKWKPTGKIFKTVGLRWVPTGKIFTYSTTKVDSEPPNGLNEDITNPYECVQTLNVSAGTLNLSAGLQGILHSNNEQSSSKLVPKVVPPADKTATSRQELELLFHHHITMLRSTINIV
ncbi:hypothetical protein Tco_0971035 [Tanacetum coccineum]